MNKIRCPRSHATVPLSYGRREHQKNLSITYPVRFKKVLATYYPNFTSVAVPISTHPTVQCTVPTYPTLRSPFPFSRQYRQVQLPGQFCYSRVANSQIT